MYTRTNTYMNLGNARPAGLSEIDIGCPQTDFGSNVPATQIGVSG